MNGPRKFLFAVMFVILAAVFSSASDIYIAQNATGGNTGADCADAHAASWFNSSANWGSNNNQIGAGVTVHLCGTFTGTAGANVLMAHGSGTSGNPITILFENGAGITSPVCGGNSAGCIDVLGLSYITIDGGIPCGSSNGGGTSPNTCNGVIQNTANGTNLTYHQDSYAIEAGNCSNCEFRNLGIYNIYVHTSSSDTGADQQEMTAIHANNGSGISIHDSLFHDAGWAITGPVTTSFQVYNTYIYNVDHGIAVGSGNSTYGNMFFHDNHFGSMANWDMTSGGAHHDSIHLWGDQGGNPIAGPVYIYNNQFDGDPGQYANAYVYLEQAVSNTTIFNNVMISPSNRDFPTQICQCNKGSSPSANNASFNNTVLGGSWSVGGSTNLLVSGTNEQWINNVLQGQNTVLYFQAGSIATNGVLTNIYENTSADGGDTNTLSFMPGNNTSSLAAFQAQLPAGSGKDAGAQMLTDAAMNLDGQGYPQSGSPVAQKGTNLSNLCTGALAPLCSDKAGNPRPQNGPWDVGAYNANQGNNAPSPPTGLQASVN